MAVGEVDQESDRTADHSITSAFLIKSAIMIKQ